MASDTFVAERLSLARHRRGWNKTKLAKEVGLKAPTITAYERHEREPEPAMIDRLAAALRFPSSFFYAELGDVVPLEATSFRSLSRMTASQRDAALAAGTLCMQLNAWIDERFNLPTTDVPDFDPAVIDPEGAAVLVRADWGLGSQPIDNVLQTLEAHGVRVFALATEFKEVDAFSFWNESTSTPFIIVSTHKTPERQLFDLAHELGHLVLHRDHGAPRGREEEREADQFASSFLLPADDLRRAAPRSPTFNQLVAAKHRWRVSVAALSRRMNQLDLISDWHYHNHCIQLSTIGRSQEPNSLPREQSQMLTKVLAALRERGISRADVARDLDLHLRDVEALIGPLVVSVVSGEGDSTGGPRANLRLVD